MSEDTNRVSDPTGGEPFDLEKLQTLMELMEKHGLTELSLKNSGQVWRLRRGSHEAVPLMMAPPQNYAPPPQHAAPSAQSAGESRPKPPEDLGLVIKSPTVGTFYSAPSPDDPPFVTVGSKVRPDTLVCIIEAMKVFNQIPAEVSGTITAILANNGDAVEFDQPLFRLDPA
jgi:acetyl-CoA carboxylase biotin carboxyl carrier protein